MSLLKYIDRTKRMDDLIRRRATGSSDEFARKLDISRSVLMENIRDLKELGAPIQYSDLCQTYYYEYEFEFFAHNQKDLQKIRGGNYQFLLQSDIIGL